MVLDDELLAVEDDEECICGITSMEAGPVYAILFVLHSDDAMMRSLCCCPSHVQKVSDGGGRR